MAFALPQDTQRVRVLIAPAGDGALIVPVGEEFTPAWPEPVKKLEDGSTLRVLVFPVTSQNPQLPSPPKGREHVVLDFAIENLRDDQGIEFTTSQQLRMIEPSGAFILPSSLTQQIGCRLDDGDVIPPRHQRRFLVVYEVPVGIPKRLQYRGFEIDEAIVDLN
jgi:hypothetical protein